MPVDRHISNSGQCRGGICAGFGFLSFRRIRSKRISTFRTLAARSPRALMLLGGMKFCLPYASGQRFQFPATPACCIGAFAHFRR